MVEVNILGSLQVVDDGADIQIGPLKCCRTRAPATTSFDSRCHCSPDNPSDDLFETALAASNERADRAGNVRWNLVFARERANAGHRHDSDVASASSQASTCRSQEPRCAGCRLHCDSWSERRYARPPGSRTFRRHPLGHIIDR